MLAVRKMVVSDVDRAADVHLAAFPSFFLSSLGRGFLRQLYRGFVQDTSAVHYIAELDGRLCGTVVGSISPRGFFRRLLMARWWAFGWAAVGPMLRRPTILPRVARGLFYRGESPAGAGRALLSSIAVDPTMQKAGVGKALMAAWLTEVKGRGASGCYLTTDAVGNDGVNQFYQRQGWALESTFTTPEGRKMNRYVYDFQKP